MPLLLPCYLELALEGLPLLDEEGHIDGISV